MACRYSCYRQLANALVVFMISTPLVDLARADGAAIESLLKNQRVDVDQSVHVVRLADGKTLFEKNATTQLGPASVTKVITTAAVLAKFSPVHTFKTRFFHTGERIGEKIKGDLVVVGDGDPFVVSEKLWQLAADFRHMGITEITGNIVVDNSLFDGVTRDKSRESGQKRSGNSYDAPVSAFGVNFNTVALAVSPADKEGAMARVAIDPYPLANFKTANSIKTVAPGGQTKLMMRREGSGKVVASGSIASGEPLQKVYRSIAESVETSGEYVRSFLAATGVAVNGKVISGVVPQNATSLYVLESYNLRRIVQGLNTFSNNYIADVLVKRLGAAFPPEGQPDTAGQGTYDNGIAVIRKFLVDDVGIKDNFVLENGSGLSIENRLSAQQVTAVLQYMEKRMDVYPDFLASLPASGWDGTLRRRFHGSSVDKYAGLVRAKTGTLTDPVSVAGLAGYFRHPEHGMVAFCILENGRPGKKQPSIVDLRDGQDEVVVALHGKL